MRVNSINTVIPNIQNKRTQISFMNNKTEPTLAVQTPDTIQFKKNFAKAVNPNAAEEGKLIKSTAKKAWKAIKNFFQPDEDLSNLSFDQLAYRSLYRL